MAQVAMSRLRWTYTNKGKLAPTLEEDDILKKSSQKAERSQVCGQGLGCWFGYAATWKMGSFMSVLKGPFLPNLQRASIMAVTGLVAGAYALEMSQRPIVEEILELDGSQLQKDMVKIITEDLVGFSSLMRLLSKHFYEERVVNDSSPDSTIIRWCHRNASRHTVLYGDKLQDHGSPVEYGGNPHGHRLHIVSRVPSFSDLNEKKASVQSKRLPIGNSSDGMDDYLEGSFGHPTPVEEIQLPGGTTRKQKRSHRRRRHEVSEIGTNGGDSTNLNSDNP